MDAEELQAIAARDQLWANLRILRPEIDRLAQGHSEGSEREQQMLHLLARVVAAELRFRSGESK